MIRIAAFDVDGTLTRRDCVVPFIRQVAGTRPMVKQLALGARQSIPAVVRRDRDCLKALGAHAAFAGRDVAEVQQLADVFAADVFATGLRPDQWSAMSRHAAAGDQIVLVSASFEIYLRPLAELLGANDVLAVRLETDGDIFTGNLVGPNCRGPERVARRTPRRPSERARHGVWRLGRRPRTAARLRHSGLRRLKLARLASCQQPLESPRFRGR
ncbi:MAG: HAD-IB family hydrolase [Acidimicrobiales bacterium]